ncbi:Protein of unknown function (DUF3632) domain containing protein [Naviculisporaceae sp. PSN 640]
MTTDTSTQQKNAASDLLYDAFHTLESLTSSTTQIEDATIAANKIAGEIVKGSKLLLKNTEELNDYVYETWTGFFDLVGKTSPAQHPILHVLLELRKFAPDGDTAGSTFIVQNDGVLWKDLPTFGWVARDLWNFDPYDANATQADQTRWANWTAFLAKLTAIALSEPDSATDSPRGNALDFSNFALWALRDAFEEARPKEGDSSTAVKLAALWIKYAGKELKLASQKGLELPQAQGRGGGEFASRGWTGFNEERWAVWREGFQVAAGEEQTSGEDSAACSASKVSEDVRQMARKVAALME